MSAFDSVVTWKKDGDPASFPACSRPDGTLVDLRDYDRAYPERWQAGLVSKGVPPHIVKAGLESSPVGFVLLTGGA